MILFSSQKKGGRGFTLVETLIYLALFSLLMSGAVVGSYNLLEGGSRNKIAVGIQEEGIFLNRKINWALTNASAVSASSGGTRLTITRPDLGSQSPLIITGTGTKIILKRGASVPIELNSDRYVVTGPASGKLFSVQSAASGRPPSVTISFEIQGKPFMCRTYVRQ